MWIRAVLEKLSGRSRAGYQKTVGKRPPDPEEVGSGPREREKAQDALPEAQESAGRPPETETGERSQTWQQEHPGFQNAGMRKIAGKKFPAEKKYDRRREEVMANMCYDNRELSWLKFYIRVLVEA